MQPAAFRENKNGLDFTLAPKLCYAVPGPAQPHLTGLRLTPLRHVWYRYYSLKPTYKANATGTV